MMIVGKNKGLCVASAVVLGCAHAAAIALILMKCTRPGMQKIVQKAKKTVTDLCEDLIG